MDNEFDFVLDDDLLVENADVLNESWLDKYIVRSITKAESAKLQVPKKDLHCSVMHFSDKKGNPKGFIAYTHRAGSGFYDKIEDIPAKKLRFISSTS